MQTAFDVSVPSSNCAAMSVGAELKQIGQMTTPSDTIGKLEQNCGAPPSSDQVTSPPPASAIVVSSIEKLAMNASTDQLYGAVQHGLELVALNHVYGPEPQEGIASFQEKRPADWRKFREGQGPEPG